MKLTVTDAAKAMGITPMCLRLGLRQQRFPFGTAVKMKRWTYYINAERFKRYMQGGEA